MDKVSERPTRLESSAGSSNCPILRGLTLCSCIFTNVRPPLASDFTKIIDNILFSPPSSPLFFLSVYVVSFLSQIQLSLRTHRSPRGYRSLRERWPTRACEFVFHTRHTTGLKKQFLSFFAFLFLRLLRSRNKQSKSINRTRIYLSISVLTMTSYSDETAHFNCTKGIFNGHDPRTRRRRARKMCCTYSIQFLNCLSFQIQFNDRLLFDLS